MPRGHRISFAFLLVGVCLAFSPVVLPQLQPNGQPCDGDCGGQLPACQRAWQPYISAVFLGRATEVQTEDVPIVMGGEKKRTERVLVTFAVEEAFIGVSEKTVALSSGGDMCGFPLSKGREYLVYARRLPNGELYVSTCYGTNFAEYAADDLKYLRGLPIAPHGATTVFGTALRFTEPLGQEFQLRRGVPEVGHKIKISGIDQNYETTVDDHGNFRIAGLPPGRYSVSLDSLGEVYIAPPAKSTVDLADKGCAEFSFRVDPYSFATTTFQCPLPPDFRFIRVDRESKRLFLEGSETDVVSTVKTEGYLRRLNRIIEVCQPSWKGSWSVSFFADPKLAGYKTDAALLEAVQNGDWSRAYIAEYDRADQRLTVFPQDPQKRKTKQVIVAR
jgi:hypothetical protein